MVHGELLQLAVAHQINAAVAHVGDGDGIIAHQHGNDGRAHAALVGIIGAGRANRGISSPHRLGQHARAGDRSSAVAVGGSLR